MDCFGKFNCKGLCCYDGVYLSDDDIKKINECLEKYPECFEDKGYLEISSWKDYAGQKKTKAVALKEFRDDYPKHFDQTRCFFQDEETGKCLLQKVALEHGEDGWTYKPFTCCTFPLRKREGEVTLLQNKEEDPNIYDDYDGYESCLPCFKNINIDELEDEKNILIK